MPTLVTTPNPEEWRVEGFGQNSIRCEIITSTINQHISPRKKALESELLAHIRAEFLINVVDQRFKQDPGTFPSIEFRFVERDVMWSLLGHTPPPRNN